MSDRLTGDLTLDALGMALVRRRPPYGAASFGSWSQYASGDYQRLLARHGIVGRMSRRGHCWDNAVAESFFATIKVSWSTMRPATRAAARSELVEYLESSTTDSDAIWPYLSPRAFERQREHEALAT